jgi:SAM-dependent methyltransferase
MSGASKEMLRPAVRYARLVRYAGRGRDCPCCGRSFRRFRAAGDPPRPDAACPSCNSLERHRLLVLVIQREPTLANGRFLHFAAEPALTPLLRARASEYVTTDLSAHSDVTADIVDLPFPAARWDTILCSHVLEHVTDDAGAMRELRRVLAPGGQAIIVVPRNDGVPTDEDPSVTDPGERERCFGQFDHVRVYGDDLEDRLRSAGFLDIREERIDNFSAEQVQRYRLRAGGDGPADALLICR